MNNPVHTTSDGRQLQRTFYTPYFMDALTGRNSQNYNSYYRPISEGMANVGNFFGRYNLYLDMAKPLTQEDQTFADEINHLYKGSVDATLTDRKTNVGVPEDFKSNMPIIPREEPYDQELAGILRESMYKGNQRQPSRLDYINRESAFLANPEAREWLNKQPRRQRDVGM